MKISMCRSASAVFVVALAMTTGCEEARRERPSVMFDTGMSPADAAASDGSRADGGVMEGTDASIPVDASGIDAGQNRCGAITAMGTCEGTMARWCESGAVREQDCASMGDICGVNAAGMRCIDAPPPECGNAIEQEQLRITNVERMRGGAGPLVCDAGLTRSARLHSQDMCTQNYFSHTSRDGRTMTDRINAQGVTWRRIGENIARGQATPADVHESWFNSPGHRANLMNPAFGRIGIGHIPCGGTGPYWTQNFAN